MTTRRANPHPTLLRCRRVRLLVELSAEHPTLPAAELRALAEMHGGHLVEQDGAAAIVDVPDSVGVEPLRARLALSHALFAHWFSVAATPRAMVPPFGRIDMKGESFAIRARRLAGAHADLPLNDTVRAIGAILAASGKVDLTNPSVEIGILLAEEAHVGALVGTVDRRALDARHPKHREHFAPVSLHPRYARALVNMARVPVGGRVADPFVGTGGLLIEAGLMGARLYGGDVDARMVMGTRAQLAREGIEGASIEERDVGELPEWTGGELDAVVSDPPYGRSSSTNRESMVALYDRFFEASHAALKDGGRLAVIFPSDELRQRAAERFRLVESHDQRVHKSMTRHWAVFVK